MDNIPNVGFIYAQPECDRRYNLYSTISHRFKSHLGWDYRDIVGLHELLLDLRPRGRRHTGMVR